MHEHECDLLEDTMYLQLVSLWFEFSNGIAVFDTNSPAHLLWEKKVWEALLAAVPLEHKCMQTVLLAREIRHMIKWDRDSIHNVNTHFGKMNETCKLWATWTPSLLTMS